MKFDSFWTISLLAVLCMVAAILAGVCGIAGGMIIGPLFLTYGMHPKVMGGTN